MLEALQLLQPEALNLPEHGEISSFIGSLVSRAKKGKTGTPGTRALPVPENVKKLIRDLDSDWAATNHKVIRGDKLVKYTMLDVYIHLKAAHDSSGSLDRFPTENQVKSYLDRFPTDDQTKSSHNSTSHKPGSGHDSDSENDDLPITVLLGSSSAK